MIAFVGISPFLRIALRDAMVTMHFYIAQIGLSFRKKQQQFFAFRGPGSNLSLMRNCPGVQGMSLDAGVFNK